MHGRLKEENKPEQAKIISNHLIIEKKKYQKVNFRAQKFQKEKKI